MDIDFKETCVNQELFNKANKDLKKANRKFWGLLFFILIIVLVVLYMELPENLQFLHLGSLFNSITSAFTNNPILGLIFAMLFYTLLFMAVIFLPLLINFFINTKYEKRFYKTSFPILLLDLFKEYNPLANIKPDDESLLPLLNLQLDEPMISLVFESKTEMYRGTAFLFYQSKLVTETNNDDKEHYYRISQGLALKLKPYNYKEVENTIQVLPRKSSLSLEALFAKVKSLFGENSNEIMLEDPRFNEAFRVLSTNQIESRIVLTPAKMEAINKYRNLLGEMSIIYEKDEIFILYSDIKLLNMETISENSLPPELSYASLDGLKKKVEQAINYVTILWD